MSQQNTIPSRQTCLDLIDASDMLPNIKKHCHAVCRVAVMIAKTLNAQGAHYELAVIEAAALLHDITKTRSLTTAENHSLTGAETVAARGYHSVADIIRQHVSPDNGGHAVTAAEIVSYADKRVLHDRVVPLHERFAYLKTRYGKSQQDMRRIDAARQRTEDIEQRIVDMLPTGMPDTFFTNQGTP
jgi:uncharacterized protein